MKILGAVLVVMGSVFILQGINILPGSFMTGQTKWAVYGSVSVIAGVILFIAANRRGT